MYKRNFWRNFMMACSPPRNSYGSHAPTTTLIAVLQIIAPYCFHLKGLT